MSAPATLLEDKDWRWPVDPAAYDRTLELRPAERAAVAAVVDQRDRHRARDPAAMAGVERLLRPVWDLLAATGTHPTTVKHAEGVLLREMHARQRPYWAWTADEWHGILADGPTAPIYRTRAEQYRHRLLLVAYVLCGLGVLRSRES